MKTGPSLISSPIVGFSEGTASRAIGRPWRVFSASPWRDIRAGPRRECGPLLTRCGKPRSSLLHAKRHHALMGVPLDPPSSESDVVGLSLLPPAFVGIDKMVQPCARRGAAEA